MTRAGENAENRVVDLMDALERSVREARKARAAASAIWPEPNWRDTQADPCTCSPGDGTVECERFDECYEAFNCYEAFCRAQESVREGGIGVGDPALPPTPVKSDMPHTTSENADSRVGPVTS